MAVQAIPIVTAVGEFAAPYLLRKAGEIGLTRFIQVYGGAAAASIGIQKTQPVDLQTEKIMGMPVSRITGQGEVYNDIDYSAIDEDREVEPLKYIPEIHGGKGPIKPTKPEGFPAETEVKKWDESFKAPEKIETNKGFEVPSQEKVVPPGFETPDIVDTSILTKDITQQTKDLVTKEPEFGALTRAEKKTARLEKGDKPDFYSRAIEAITNAKQDTYTKGKWKSIVKGNTTKDEMDYLGLTELLEGKESITKQELLKLVKDKDIASGMTVKSIPKDQMNPMYEGYSLGGNQEHIVFQIGFNPAEDDKSVQYREPHFADYSPQYAEDTFAHARVQVGFDKGFSAKYDDLPSEVIDKLKNTQIVDEIQSQWIQTGQKQGFVSEFDAIKGSELVAYLDKNKIKYEIETDPLNQGFKDYQAIRLYHSPVATNDLDDERNFTLMDFTPNTHYLFGYPRKIIDSENGEVYAPGKEIDRSQAKEFKRKISPNAWQGDIREHISAVPDLPIKDSKKFVELVLNEMIRKAVKDGRDSIAITNGQIQYNRYEAMEEKERQGLKKFYDTFVYDQLNKIAKNYGVELERININEGSEPAEGEDLKRISSKIRTATRDGYELKKVNLQFLWDRTKDTAIPDHASLYTNEGRGQGAEYIEDWLHNLVDNRAFSPETGQGSGYPKWEKIKNDEVYIWIKERDISKDLIGWEMPIIPVRDASNVEAQTQAQSTDVGFYQNYLKNYKPPEGIDLGYEQDAEQLIKMKLPKKLQKKKLSESQRLTKVKQQTQRMFG